MTHFKDYALLLDRLHTIALRAGGEILRIYHTTDSDSLEVHTKTDTSPLTAADLASHNTILQGLALLNKELGLDYPILSEENYEELDWDTRRSWSSFWLVDPLDGTKEFINRNGEFTVNIALIYGARPIAGVVYVPTQNTSYLGSVETGAFKRHPDHDDQPLHVPTTAQNPIRVAASRSHPSAKLNTLLQHLGPHTLVPTGSSLKFCKLADGSIDIYPRLGLTSEWDTAAAQAVLEAAGGHVVQWDGTPLNYNQKENILNPHFLACSSPDLLKHTLQTYASLQDS